ncbi:TauD/TfdA family dioxygenase [Sphingopyxis sp. CCNWLW253]|uniref:TauD/TfdA dioxygenase family protein n=1 Tax=unclassified Sphingopyxis TaxID=2614943 RepID=UPI003012F11C
MAGPFGAVVDGLDLSTQPDERTVGALIDALHDHQILAIRGQAISHADYVAFGRHWGTPLSFFLAAHKRDDHPEMIRITNAAATPERYRDGAMHWHSDSSYEDVPASVTLLYGAEVPSVGGETMIASSALAYDALDAKMKDRIDGLMALHCLGGSPPLPDEKIPFIPESTALHGIKRHPLVMPHPVTGRRSLFTSATAFGIDGMDRDEGRALIAMLRAHITEARFVTRYKVEVGDIFLWDNYQTLHSATPIEYSDEPGKRRLLYRISTKGTPALRPGTY